MSKNRSNLLILICSIVVVFTVYGLLNSSPWLDYDLPAGIPLGNVFTSISYVALAVISIVCAPKKRWAFILSRFVLAAALCWYPVGIIWSGNLRLEFQQNGEYWLPFSIYLAVFCLVVCVSFLIYTLVTKTNILNKKNT